MKQPVLRGKPIANHIRFALGRFASVRAGYGVARGLFDKREPLPTGFSHLESLDVDAVVDALRRDSVYRPLRLSPESVAHLRKLATEQPVRSPTKECPFVPYEAVLEYNRQKKAPVFLYGSVPAAETDPVAMAIVDDPQILAAATRFLGYVPRRRRMRLQWSFVCEAPPASRMARGQTVFYHYDADDLNFVYTMFYLTDTDIDSGAHLMIPGTHNEKPTSWLLSRSWRTDEEVFAVYDRAREILIEGPAGSGFIQDSSCMHKALAPTARPRLAFQVRYS